jgi:protein-tyrosine phosphatase
MQETRTVLFLCTGNYYRSRFAEMLFNARVGPKSGWRAESRGFQPSPANPGPIAASVLARLSALGIPHPPAIRMPLRATEHDLAAAELIVALDDVEHPPYVADLFPQWAPKIVYWQVRDLGFTPVDEALAGIERAVERLAGELQPRT